MEQQFTYKRTIFSVDVYGDKFELKKPTGIQKQEWLNSMDEINQRVAREEEVEAMEDTNLTADFLEGLGLPREVFFTMEDEHQLELVNNVITGKKS